MRRPRRGPLQLPLIIRRRQGAVQRVSDSLSASFAPPSGTFQNNHSPKDGKGDGLSENLLSQSGSAFRPFSRPHDGFAHRTARQECMPEPHAGAIRRDRTKGLHTGQHAKNAYRNHMPGQYAETARRDCTPEQHAKNACRNHMSGQYAETARRVCTPGQHAKNAYRNHMSGQYAETARRVCTPDSMPRMHTGTTCRGNTPRPHDGFAHRTACQECMPELHAGAIRRDRTTRSARKVRERASLPAPKPQKHL